MSAQGLSAADAARFAGKVRALCRRCERLHQRNADLRAQLLDMRRRNAEARARLGALIAELPPDSREELQ